MSEGDDVPSIVRFVDDEPIGPSPDVAHQKSKVREGAFRPELPLRKSTNVRLHLVEELKRLAFLLALVPGGRLDNLRLGFRLNDDPAAHRAKRARMSAKTSSAGLPTERPERTFSARRRISAWYSGESQESSSSSMRSSPAAMSSSATWRRSASDMDAACFRISSMSSTAVMVSLYQSRRRWSTADRVAPYARAVRSLSLLLALLLTWFLTSCAGVGRLWARPGACGVNGASGRRSPAMENPDHLPH